jgi:periplasmic divalent cation tolerance protein
MIHELELCEVTITAPDRDWLAGLCRELIDARLASSAHVMFPVASIYRWDGSIHDAVEARAFLRSRYALVDAIVAHVIERHPYVVPHVTATAIVGGNPRYLEWIKQST